MQIIEPKKVNKIQSLTTICARCGREQDIARFPYSNSITSQTGHADYCASCLGAILREHNNSWDAADLICQYLNIPFVPERWEQCTKLGSEQETIALYSDIFKEQIHETLNWHEYYKQFKTLEEQKLIERELPGIKDDKITQLAAKWGENYSPEQLYYLEDLYAGMLLSQNIAGALQIDQAKKLCKTSLEIDERIRGGEDYDKMLASYDKLVKIAEFTPKNAKNAADFDSVGELVRWLEKTGWRAKYFDDVTKDIVDETLKNIESYNQKLYVNESGIGEEISRRIEALKAASEIENYYDAQPNFDLDEFQNEGFEDLMNDEFREEI